MKNKYLFYKNSWNKIKTVANDKITALEWRLQRNCGFLFHELCNLRKIKNIAAVKLYYLTGKSWIINDNRLHCMQQS